MIVEQNFITENNSPMMTETIKKYIEFAIENGFKAPVVITFCDNLQF
jgi:hypothetical protein